MISQPELLKWVRTLSPDHYVGIDDGGLTLVELTPNCKPTAAYLEVGGFDENEN
jgi:hypothetical protein